MKKYLQFLAIILVVMLGVPAVALLGSSKNLQENPPDLSVSSAPSSPQPEPDQGKKEPTAQANPTIEILNHTTQKKESLSMKDYIKGVVCAEMPASYETEALKAQAVIAHTYTLRMIANQLKSPNPELQGAQISTDPAHYQAYISEADAKTKFGEKFDAVWGKITTCVEEVFHQIITYDNEPILAAFHAISAGNTEAAQNVWGKQLPYLVPAESKNDELAPNFKNTVSLTQDQVKDILYQNYPDISFSEDASQWLSITSNTASGYVDNIKILNKQATGQDVRKLFGLKSANFTIAFNSGNFTFTTKGYGHGVGLSQYGADSLAKEGKNYQEILAHYYPQTKLEAIS